MYAERGGARRARRTTPCAALRAAAPVLVLILVCLGGAAEAQGPPQAIADELLVKMRGPAANAPDRVRGVWRRFGAEGLEELPAQRLHRVRVPAAARDGLSRALEGLAEVEYVEPNRRFEPATVPDDPDLDLQWHHAMVGSTSAWSWAYGQGQVIAVLDSGVDRAHPDLKGRLLSGWDAWNDDDDPDDVHGHGTMVAGVAAAATGNGIGVAGMAWGGWILPVRVAGDDGWATSWSIARGIDYAVRRGADVVNLSFAGLVGSQTVIDAARRAVQAGIVVVGSAGNCGCTQGGADTPWILSVGATTPTDGLASFSSRGDYVDLSAPGQTIRTTVRGGRYGSPSGTSFSAPLVAGIVALMRRVDPTLTPAEIETLLVATAEDRGPRGWDPGFGHGRVDAAAALTMVVAQGPARCGLGFELVLVLPLLSGLRAVRRGRRARA